MRNGSERRRVQRIVFDTPVTASLSGLAGKLVDISTVGAQVEHEFPLGTGRRVRLSFERSGEKLSLMCEVVRCRLQRSTSSPAIVYTSGLRFVDSEDGSRETVRKLVAAHIIERRNSRTAAPLSASA